MLMEDLKYLQKIDPADVKKEMLDRAAQSLNMLASREPLSDEFCSAIRDCHPFTVAGLRPLLSESTKRQLGL